MAIATTDTQRRFAAAVEMIRTHDAALRRTARRHSSCRDDAEDAYQRALEILLTKAPEIEPPGLVAWMHTVTKHEAMGVRRSRERLVGTRVGPIRDAGGLIQRAGDSEHDRTDFFEIICRDGRVDVSMQVDRREPAHHQSVRSSWIERSHRSSASRPA